MAVIFDESVPFNPKEWGLEPESRGFLGATNDYVIEAANAVLGGIKAVSDFAVPGSELANQIEALIRQGEESQSDVARQAKQRLGEDIDAGGMQALKGVGSYVVENPALAVSQAVGSFAIPFGAIRGAQLGARGLGVGERAVARAREVGPITRQTALAAERRAIDRVGTGAGMATGAVLGAGEAAGDAYGQVYEGLIEQGVDPVEAERQAMEAARLAMPAPALVGAIAGRFGAERAVATGSRGGSILRMAGSEAAQEFAEEGTTKLSANIAAGQYVDGIDPMKGVLGSAALGAALGGITGGAIGTITPRDNQPGSLLGGSNDNLTGSRTPGGDSLRQAINTGPSLPEVITVSPRGEAFISPEQQEAYDRFGQMAGRPNVAVSPQAAPAATGTPAAAPAAAQQTTRGQQAQAQPVTQDEYIATAQAYGVTPVTGVANTWDIGGARVYGQPNIKTVVEGLAEADRQATPIQRQITNALFAAGLVKAPANVANAKPIINAVGKSVQKYGLTDVASIEEAVGRINDQIGILARQGKPATNTLVEQLDQLHNVLTGQSSPVYTQLLEGAPNEQQTATGVGAVSEQAGAGQAVGGVGRTDAGPVQSLLTGSVAGQPTGVQNVAARTGGARGGAAVAPAGGPVGDGRPVSGQVADQGQEVNVQPTGRAGPGAQTDVGRPAGVTGLGAERAGAGTAEATGGAQQTVESGVERAGETEEVATARRLFDGIASRFGVNSRFDNLSPSLQNIWQQAVDANQANIEVVRALDAENDINTASMSAQSVLDAAVAKLFPLERQQNKAQFVAEMLGTPQTARNETVKQLAARFGVSEDTIKKDWNRAVKALFGEDRPKLVTAINAVFAERGLNQDQISELMADLNEAVTLANTVETLTSVPEGETKVDARDLADPEKDVREADRKSLSVSEFGNEAETLSARYVNLSEEIDTVEQELEAARAEGNEDIVAQLSTRLGELTTSLAETEAAIVKNADRQVKAVRRTAGRVKQEKEDAVRESGAEKLDVRQRARDGEKVAKKDAQKPAVAREGKAEGQAKTEGKVVRVVKAAPKAAPAPAAPVELTKAEQVEAKYNELRGFAPDVLPTWDMLTDEQRNTLLAIDKPADINFKNLEQIVDQTNVIEGEVRVVPDAERTLLLEQTSKLNESQTKLLESHYGDKAGTDAFLSKLSDDITTFVNRGAEFVAARIRGIIQQLAKAAIAAAIVFNPNITGNGFNFNLQEAYASIQSSQVEVVVPADVASQMSEEAKIIYRQVAPLAKQEQRGFMIADKRNGKLHMFFASGQHLASDTALYGKDIGDTLEGNSLKGGKKITPTGKYTLKPVEDADYEGGWRLDLVETFDDGTVIAVHPAYLGDVNERRLERLASPDVKDKRISYGCINTSHELFLNKIKPQLGEFNGGFIYVLPEAPFAPTTPAAKPKVNAMRRRDDDKARGEFMAAAQRVDDLTGRVKNSQEAANVARENADRYAKKNGKNEFWRGLDEQAKIYEREVNEAKVELRKAEDALAKIQYTPPQNEMRRQAEKQVQEVTGDNDSLLIEDASLDEMSEAYEGVAELRKRYDKLGISNAFNAVGQFFVSYNNNVDWDGIVTNIDQNVAVVLRQDIANNSGAALWTMSHEVGHAVDQTVQGEDTFSSDPRLNLRFVNGKIIPLGEVAIEIDQFRKSNETAGTIFAYPLDPAEVEGMSQSDVRRELFAQIWAFATASPQTMKLLEQNAPKTAAYIKEVISRVQETTDFQATNLGQKAAFDSRAEGVDAGRRRLDEQADGAEAQAAKFLRSRQATGAARAINRLPQAAQPQATLIYYTLKDWASKVAPTFAFTQDLVDMAKGRMRAAKDFIRLFNEKQVTQTEYELQVKKIIDDFDALPQELKGIGAGSVNEFLKDSTMSGKWGYKLKPDSDVELDPALEARFNAFPDNAQKVIKAVFNHGYQTLQDMKNTIRTNINTEYDALIEEAKNTGNDQEVAELQAAKDGLLRDYQQLFAIKGNKPYAPLKRFGDYIVIGKSQRLLDLEEVFETVKGKDKAAVRKQITELQRQPEHYYVGFAETAGDGQVLAESISRQYDFVSEPFERSVEDSLYGGSDLNQVFARLRNLSEEALKSSDKDMVARGVRKTILDMQTMMLSQQSVMHATNRRLGVAGADLDMMRAFATQGRASAHFIGSLTNTSKIYESLREMKKQAGYDPESRRYFNEFVRRHAMGYDYDPSPILNKAMATTSLWMLLTSPAYYLQNMTQPFMMSVPFMAGKHGEGRSLKSLFAAYPETLALLKDISIKRPGQQVDFDGLPADVREAVKELVKRGRIQITLDRDLGEFTSAEGGVLRNLGKTSEYLRGIAEKAELINRVATAIAAYRLEIANGADSSKAINYADKVIRITHGDYSGANAPRVMRKGIGRLVTQFRKFQLIQISMMVRLLNDATKGQTAKDRAMARKALVWTMTHAGIAGGIMGLPGFAAAAALYGMLFSEEDEPFNAELELRNYFGDELGTLMTKGVPANFGVDLSGKIGMGQMLSILPYTDFDLSRAGWQETVTAAMGPFIGGLAPRAIDGARFVSEGNYYRGLENFAPKGVSDTLKAYRLANEGVTQRNNDVTLTPDELNFADILFQGLGLPTTKLTEQQFRTSSKIETTEFYSKLTTELKRDYSKAYRDNDRPAMEAVRQRWKIVQDKRVSLGLKRQPLSELLKSPREQRQRERQTAGGVQYTPATRKFVESLPQ
jgi:predicted amino acid-binding ACT domain protein